MMQCLAKVLIVLFGLVIFSHAKENKCPEGKACPIQNAVCFGDSAHCCPDGYTYDVIKGICKMGGKLVPLLRTFPAKPIMNKTVLASNTKGEIISSDGFHCHDSQTRCRLPFGPHACCPLPQAVCCSDISYCCPNGHTCDAAARECIKGFRTNAVLQKISALKTTIQSAPNVICRDKKTRCPRRQTCCKADEETYRCCIFHTGRCCPGGLFCCPLEYVCNMLIFACVPIRSKAILQKLTPTKKGALDMTSYGIKKSLVSDLKYIHCPDASSCFDYETCCELAGGQYGCCPSSKAVCCSDHEHYCPAGFRCDLTAKMCVKGNARLPMLKKAKSTPRRTKTQQVALDEKIHFVPSGAHGGDDYLARKYLKSEDIDCRK